MNRFEDLKGIQNSIDQMFSRTTDEAKKHWLSNAFRQDKEHKHLITLIQMQYLQIGYIIEELEDIKKTYTGASHD